jgi:hypothetical protein
MTPEEKAVIEAAMDGQGVGEWPTTAQQTRLRQAVHALIFSCPECNAGGHTCPGDGNPIGHTQTDCGDHDETHPEPLTGAVASEWVPATLVQCLAGDHIRIGTDETDVLRSSSGIWHADNSDAWQPKKWNHLELRMELVANPGFQEYPPNTPCEILCTPERKAVLLLQARFPGSAVVSSDVD